MIAIKSINLNGKVPVVAYSDIGETRSTDSVFPGKKSQEIPPAASFMNAVANLESVFVEDIPEFSADSDRKWLITSLSFIWNDEFSEYGFSVRFSGIKQGAMSISPEAKESSPDQIPDRIYAALEVLRDEAIKYVKGVSAQMSLLAIEAVEEIEEEAA